MRRSATVNSIGHGATALLGASFALLWLATPVTGQCTGDSCRVSEAPPGAVVRIVNVRGAVRCYGSGTVVATEGLEPDAAASLRDAGLPVAHVAASLRDAGLPVAHVAASLRDAGLPVAHVAASLRDAGLPVAERPGYIVLTCAHLFRQGVGRVSVAFADGRQCEATVMAADATWDLAALQIASSPVRPVAIAGDYPRPGEPLRSCGYGPDGRYWCNRGRALGYARTAGAATCETLTLSGAAREGDSGGPVLNERGELAAVLWGTDGRTVEGTYCGRIRKFLAGVLAARRPADPPPAPAPPAAAPPILVKPPAADSRVDDLRRQLETQERSIGSRLEQLDKAVGLIGGLKDRLDRAESAVGTDNLRALVRDAAGAALDRGTPGLLETVLPAVLVALGWTGPPAIAAVVGLRVLAGLVNRRRRRGRSATGPDKQAALALPLNDEYAAQLAQVYELSGRSPLADATLGRQYDEELRQAEQSSDGTLAAWARTLRERVARRFFRIHGQSPSPADPS